MAGTQTTNGKAFEWANAIASKEILGWEIQNSSSSEVAAACFSVVSPRTQQRMLKHAVKAIKHISELERFSDCSGVVRFQADNQGQKGDVRDLILETDTGRQIGLSCKFNHSALKHSRLSDKIDFVRSWNLSDTGCSDAYWSNVLPVFSHLRARKGIPWTSIDRAEKAELYWRVLDAFSAELELVYERNRKDFCNRLVRYLIGNDDFYKVISLSKRVQILANNFNGTLPIPKTLLPDQIIGIDTVNGGKYSKTVRFNRGLTFNFRIHNASSKIEPSFKFDVTAQSWPPSLYNHSIS